MPFAVGGIEVVPKPLAPAAIAAAIGSPIAEHEIHEGVVPSRTRETKIGRTAVPAEHVVIRDG